jgi:hypothetical protein
MHVGGVAFVRTPGGGARLVLEKEEDHLILFHRTGIFAQVVFDGLSGATRIKSINPFESKMCFLRHVLKMHGFGLQAQYVRHSKIPLVVP